MTCETCPPYVRKCAHKDESVLWLITSKDSGEEFARRTNQDAEALRAAGKAECPGCDGVMYPSWVATIVGPGEIDEPVCVCRIGLSSYGKQRTHVYQRLDTAVRGFAVIAGQHQMKVLR